MSVERTGFDRLTDGAIVVLAISAAVLAARSLMGSPGPRNLEPSHEEPTLVAEWEAITSTGHRLGPEDADVTVVVFSDFECPMCGTFATRTYPEFAAKHPGRVALVFRHWPLTSHRFAYPAARAAECAGDQQRFFEYHDAIFEHQGQLGLVTFDDLAELAGVPDLPAFEACLDDSQPVSAIERDVELVRSLGGRGTPTVVVNGWLLIGGVGPDLLDSISAQYF